MVHVEYFTVRYEETNLLIYIYIYIFFEYIKMVNKYYQKHKQRLRREASDTKISLKK